jgi:hypothetical protein
MPVKQLGDDLTAEDVPRRRDGAEGRRRQAVFQP